MGIYLGMFQNCYIQLLGLHVLTPLTALELEQWLRTVALSQMHLKH